MSTFGIFFIILLLGIVFQDGYSSGYSDGNTKEPTDLEMGLEQMRGFAEAQDRYEAKKAIEQEKNA